MSDRHTPWFPPAERPVRDGVYQVTPDPAAESPIIMFSYWSGRRGCWGPARFTARAASWEAGRYGVQTRHWRGLTLHAFAYAEQQ